MFNDPQDIERELKAALQVTPSPGFQASVRRRIEAPLDSRRSRVTGPVWLAAAAAVLLAAGAWYLAGLSAPDPMEEVRTVAAPDVRLAPPVEQSPDRPTVRPPDRPTARPPDRPTAWRPDWQTAPRAAAEPEVIVPPNQLEAIRRFVREVNAGRLIVPEDPVVPDPPAKLVVPALVVDPIAVVNIEPGGGPQSGGRGLQ